MTSTTDKWSEKDSPIHEQCVLSTYIVFSICFLLVEQLPVVVDTELQQLKGVNNMLVDNARPRVKILDG